jgi:hypothetical protein
MIIKQEISLENFEAWSGAVQTLQTLRDKGLCDRLENLLEDIEPEDGWTETALNDLLWFEGDYIAGLLGFEDWEDLERDGEEEEEDEEDEEDEDEEGEEESEG